jgi:hypothetical protein
MKIVLVNILFSILASVAVAQNLTVRIKFIDAATKEPVPHKTVYIDSTLIQCDDYGYVSVVLKNKSMYTLNVAGNPYRSVDTTISASSSLIVFELQKVKGMAGIVARRNSRLAYVQQNQMGMVTIPVETLRKIPAIAGEQDPLKALQFAPGIQCATEGQSNLIVRGGSNDQNLYLLDEVPMFNMSHLYGFLSLLPAESVKDVQVYKSGYPAKYGGRLSSVVNIRTRDGSLNKASSTILLGVLSASASIDRPIIKNKLGVFVNVRTTVPDKFIAGISALKNYGSESKSSYGYGFYDAVAKIVYKPNMRNSVYASFYRGNDAYFVNHSSIDKQASAEVLKRSSTQLQWGNISGSMRWHSSLRNGASIVTTSSISRYNYKRSLLASVQALPISSSAPQINSYDFSSKIISKRVTSDVALATKGRHKLHFGACADARNFVPETQTNTGPDSVVKTLDAVYNNTEIAMYASDEISLSNLSLMIGLRAEQFFAKEYRNASLQPRLSVRYMLNSTSSIKASYTQMLQNLHLLTTNAVGISNDLWVPATASAPSERSTQVSFGYYKVHKKFSFTHEAYYKNQLNIIEYLEGVSTASQSTTWEQKIAKGKGYSYGIESEIKYKDSLYEFWLGYTWSKTNRLFSEINDGKAFPFKYDRRHVIDFFAARELTQNKTLSISWSLASGAAFTLPIAAYPSPIPVVGSGVNIGGNDGGYSNLVLYSDQRNGSRFRTYHRLDIGYSVTKQKKWGECIYTLSLINAYGRNNPFAVFIRNSSWSGQPNLQIVQLSLFNFLPSASINFRFNK